MLFYYYYFIISLFYYFQIGDIVPKNAEMKTLFNERKKGTFDAKVMENIIGKKKKLRKSQKNTKKKKRQ
jgi:hypothetical protein